MEKEKGKVGKGEVKLRCIDEMCIYMHTYRYYARRFSMCMFSCMGHSNALMFLLSISFRITCTHGFYTIGHQIHIWKLTWFKYSLF